MFRSTLYIIACTARNRARLRLRRLREPRYLVGAVAGLAYLTFTLFVRQQAYLVRNGAAPPSSNSAFLSMGPIVGGVLLAWGALASWVLPFSSHLLDFTQAEIAFLFPSPMSRAHLVIYRLLRSQVAVFTAALIMALAYPTGTIEGRIRGLVAAWILLMSVRVFFAGVTLARVRLAQRTREGWRMALPALALPIAAAIASIVPLLQAPVAIHTVGEAVDVMSAGVMHWPVRLVLWPFTLLVQPLFAGSLPQFVSAVAAAAAVHVVVIAWLLWADALSEDVSDQSVERAVSRTSARGRRYVARRVAWVLTPLGRPETAFVWKGMLQTFRTVDRRVLVRVALILIWMIGASIFVTRASGLVLLFGVFATWGAVFAVFMAPQVVRMDLREDFAHLELLKTWPLRGAAVLRGEIIWPTFVVTVVAWVFGAMALILSMTSSSRIPSMNRLAAWGALLVLTPGVVLAQYTIHNAVAVLLPGWVPLGPSRPRGVDAVGQRLILLLGNWVGLAIAVLPGIAVSLLFWRTLRPIMGPFVLVIGAAVTTLMLVGEMLVATRWLGPVYERIDLSSVERPD